MSALTLGEVQGLIDSHEARTQTRHAELIGRFDGLEGRVRHLETEIAERRPIFKGVYSASAMVATALIAAFIGRHFGGG